MPDDSLDAKKGWYVLRFVIVPIVVALIGAFAAIFVYLFLHASSPMPTSSFMSADQNAPHPETTPLTEPPAFEATTTPVPASIQPSQSSNGASQAPFIAATTVPFAATTLPVTTVPFMDELRPYEKEGYAEKIGAGDNNALLMGGKKYHDGFVLNGNNTAYAVFNLEGKYSELSGIIGHMDGEGSEDRVIVIWGDGNELARIKVGFLELPREFKVPVSGVRQLKLEAASGYNYSDIGFADLKISSNPSALPSSLSTEGSSFMDELRPYEKEGYAEKIGTGDNNALLMGGKKYHDGFVLNGNNTAYAVFNLEGKYSELSGIIGHMDGEGSEDRVIVIWGDGNELARIKVVFLELPREFKVPVSGVRQLKFEAAFGYNYSDIGFAELRVKK